MVTYDIFARDILRHGFLFAEHWCVNRFLNRILVSNKIFSLTLLLCSMHFNGENISTFSFIFQLFFSESVNSIFDQLDQVKATRS